ncbi:uncharacterized protein MYCFIDRAFT_86431 [Pseudocercospora fijiensis CIRAD86]|uniref:PHD-type domain-containing protein n=1 Tax=Pseudocercospora fijiensis (strain CIRAD86) TaxID=383855 RepID=M3AV28_PSEFD|nr:uncharacterized protein MYCFIDRAFT_86431 [Pseudocercospora fijiensis CIRAD86]EME81013.1 hypothetical protein MYCFIDRAFT_86431 [Pseudocercospora fijiensis CIRAD86]
MPKSCERGIGLRMHCSLATDARTDDCDTIMPGTLASLRDHERRGSSHGPSEASSRDVGKGAGKEKGKQKTFMDRWVEPALQAPKPSYQDHGAGPYGVLEHMQPLGEAPSAKVKQRVKADGSRKSALGRSAAAGGVDAQDTPEGTPAPSGPVSHSVEPPATQPIVIDDDRDGDYAPTVNGKKKDRATRTRTVKRKSEFATSATSAVPSIKRHSPPSAPTPKFEYDGAKLHRVVEAAKQRAIEVGKPDLAAAVNEIYEQSLLDYKLRLLLEAILTQNATAQQNDEFQDYVRRAKKKLKDAKNKARQPPASKTNGTEQKSSENPQPPPTKLTSAPKPPTAPETSLAIPSTERLESHKPKISLKVKSPVKDPGRRRSGHGNMSVSPRKRSGSVGSDSSLTSLTSNEDDNDMDFDSPGDQAGGTAGPTIKLNGVRGKDHAAERGSLAVPGGSVKRSSAEAELDQDQATRDMAAKKQRMSESQTRDYEYAESNVRPTVRAPKTRALQRLVPPPVKLEQNGSRAASARGSRAPSMDLDSPLSDLSPATSRQSTPRLQRAPPKPAGKKAKTKQSPEKKQQAAFSGMSGVGGAGRDSPIGDDDNEVASENNDFCSACGGSGYLLCCDGCDRSFHLTCLDPPLEEGAKELDEPWFCFICVARRPAILDSPEKPARGLFASLFSGLKKRNPCNFVLPEDIRNFYDGVSTDKNGNFVEAMSGKPTRGKPGYSDDQPDYYKLRDSKGNLVLCYCCGKSSQQLAGPKRPIVTCDHCSQHWHLDCLDPPLSNPPALNQNGRKVVDWMCPLHVDKDLRNIDTAFLSRRRVHVRKPKHPRMMETSLSRGHVNNGVIDIFEDESDASDSEFFDQDDGGIVYKLPEKGIKLDFIDRVKDTRIQQLRDERSYQRLEQQVAATYPSALEQANFAKRPFNEQQLALNLAQFASENKDLDLGSDQVENLVGTLIAEAPSEVVEEMMAAEDAEKTRSATSVVPPSPPASEQTLELSVEQRKELQMLQELIRRKLESSKT